MKAKLRRGILEAHERAATLRCSVFLLAALVPVALASGALAQVEETSPSILSSALREATTAQTPDLEKISQRPATQSLFNVASLPPIESIGASSDIRSFLASGVPQDLTRAALRRAWVVDPAIRDFIGLSENSWDLNAPNSVPGFGSLIAADARRLLAKEAKNSMLNVSDKSANDLNKARR